MEQSLIIRIPNVPAATLTESERSTLDALRQDIRQIVDRQQLGELEEDDNDELPGVLFLYGPDVDRIFDAIEPTLAAYPITFGGRATKRYRSIVDADAPGELIELGQHGNVRTKITHKSYIGDVFTVPIDANRFGIGQVISNLHKELYVVIYEGVYSGRDPDPADAVKGRPLLATLTSEENLEDGKWRIIGNVMANRDRIAQPAYRVKVNGQVFIGSRDNALRRLLTEDELNSPSDHVRNALRPRKIYAANSVGRMLKALHGIGEWDPDYDRARYETVVASSNLLRRRRLN